MFKQSIALLFFLALISCNEKTKNTKKESTGKVNTISVFVNDLVWNSEVGDSIRKKFTTPVLGLINEEPQFTINQYPLKALESNKMFDRNIVIINIEDKEHFKVTKNKFSQPQNIVNLTAKNQRNLINLIESKHTEINQIFKTTDLKMVQNSFKKNLRSDITIFKRFRTKINIPSSYHYVVVKPNFVWLKKEFISGNNSILVYSVPFKSLLKDNLLLKNIIFVRDSIEGNYVGSMARNSRMTTDPTYLPYLNTTILDKKRAYQTKGTWKLSNDFMSGSFVNYAIIDRKRKRFLIAEGFTYAPSADQRDLMFELEAILNTIKIK